MHKALHPRDDVDRLYVSRKEGERGLASIEANVDTSRTTLKSTKADWLQPPEMILTTRMTITRKNWKKNNSIGVLND